MIIGKSPLPPLCQRGGLPPLGKGRLGGILQIDVVTILRLLITIRTWVTRSERLRGEPFVKLALMSPVHAFGRSKCSPPIPLKHQINRLTKLWRASYPCP